MKRRKFLLGSSAVFASGGFLTGTRAFSSAEVERDVKIEVVSDSEGYLGLSEVDTNGDPEHTEYLFGEGSREAPETFQIKNQTASTVNIDIKIDEGNLQFANAAIGDEAEVDSVSVDNNSLSIQGMVSGAKVSEVMVDIPGTSEFPVDDTLCFEVGDKDDSLSIEAERSLRLVPDEIPAVIDRFATISSTFEITNLDSVNHSTVSVDGFGTEHKGKNKYQIKNPSNFGCSSGNEITVTVTGKTDGGVDFSGAASVKCSQQNGSNGENKKRTGNGNSEEGDDSNGTDKGEGNSGDGNSGDNGNAGDGETSEET